MNRVIGVMASLLLLMSMSMSLGPISAQEPARTTSPPQTKGTPGGATASATASAGEGGGSCEGQEGRTEGGDGRGADRHAPPDPLGGAELKYTATAGLMPIKDAKGEIEARIFFIAYTRDDAGPDGVAAAVVQLQRRAGLGVGLAAPGGAGPRRVADARRAGDPGAAVRAGG